MEIPDLLQEHIDQLKTQGYDIEILDGQEIGILFHSYPISQSIWNNNKVDLLVVTPPSYPNSKLDMFWIIPNIMLNNGSLPKATSSEFKFGKSWQRFSWHVNSWNPAHDNLITYLDVVNDRLNRNE